MSPIRFSPSSLKAGRWYEYPVRFALGGAATVYPSGASSWPFPPSSAPVRR
jgi:hypothetical protein